MKKWEALPNGYIRKDCKTIELSSCGFDHLSREQLTEYAVLFAQALNDRESLVRKAQQ